MMGLNPEDWLTECIRKCKLTRNKLGLHAVTSLLLSVIAKI